MLISVQYLIFNFHKEYLLCDSQRKYLKALVHQSFFASALDKIVVAVRVVLENLNKKEIILI